jgi:Tfp pilus assembly protein PilV
MVELLVAVLLLATALIGLAGAVGPALLATTQGSLQTVAVHLAQDQIEVAKRTAFADLEDLDTGDDPVAAPEFGNFKRKVDVQPYTSPGGCGAAPCTGSCASGQCKQVIVTVLFASGQGEVQTTLATIRVGP